MTVEPAGQPGPRFPAAAVGFAMVWPTALTLLYFVVLAGSAVAVQQTTYAVGKTIQFGFPLLFVLLVSRERPRFFATGGRGLLAGVGFGLAVAAVMLGLYHGWLLPGGHLEQPAEEVRRKITDLGLDNVWKYVAVGLFYSVVHSLLEEYYWRWFVFRLLRRRCSSPVAIAVSSLGFMAHHVVLLGTFFGFGAPSTYLFSAGVALGGAVWARLYERSGSLVSPWISHLLVDAAIFLLGYDLAGDLLV